MQADTVILTNNNYRTDNPQTIVRDIIAGFPDEILDRNARKPWPGGFLQDPRHVEWTVRPFLQDNCWRYGPVMVLSNSGWLYVRQGHKLSGSGL